MQLPILRLKIGILSHNYRLIWTWLPSLLFASQYVSQFISQIRQCLGQDLANYWLTIMHIFNTICPRPLNELSVTVTTTGTGMGTGTGSSSVSSVGGIKAQNVQETGMTSSTILSSSSDVTSNTSKRGLFSWKKSNVNVSDSNPQMKVKSETPFYSLFKSKSSPLVAQPDIPKGAVQPLPVMDDLVHLLIPLYNSSPPLLSFEP